jgi:phage-related protein
MEFLINLKATNPSEHARIEALFTSTADHGPPIRNERKCRFLKEYKLFEFKTSGGVRVMAFWDEGKLIVCSHAFIKKKQKTPQDELDRASEARKHYFLEKELNRVRFD